MEVLVSDYSISLVQLTMYEPFCIEYLEFFTLLFPLLELFCNYSLGLFLVLQLFCYYSRVLFTVLQLLVIIP